MALSRISRSRFSPVGPTTSLSNALTDFDKALSEDERRRYRNNCGNPSAQTIIDFVSEIDTNNRGRGGRCVATRLLTFLDGIQCFTSVIDTFISSNPRIAALLWGGIKTTILVASNFASYFDKITGLIMEIGRSCPTYKDFGDLFPTSASLQTALSDYFATVVRLCMRIIQESHASSRSLFRAFVPLDATFMPYQDDLKQALQNVQLQITLASLRAAENDRQLSDTERKKNYRFRQSFSKFDAENRKWQLQRELREATKLKTAIKYTLSSVDHTKHWKRSRQQCVVDTNTWVEHDENFLAWMRDKDSSTLWCSGTLGAGKTILVSSVVAHLFSIRKPGDHVSYFFCQPEDSNSLTARNIFGSIAFQLIHSYIEEANVDQLDDIYRQSQSFDVEDVPFLDLLTTRLKPGSSNYIIIDGLDECEETEIQKASEMITTLGKIYTIPFKILCAGRPTLERHLFQNTEPRHKVTISGTKVDSDIKRYVKVTLDEKLGKNLLHLHDPSVILEIQDVLLRKAQGMFLWTHLLIEDICAQETDTDIRNVLKNPPARLKDLFRRITHRINRRTGAARALKVLQICGVAKRPLAIKELREALTIERGQKDLDTGRLTNDPDQLIADCGSFIFVDEEEQTLHYVHHSARTYLFTDDPDSDINTFDEAGLNKEFGTHCMVYLNFNALQGQLTRPRNYRNFAIDPLDIVSTALDPGPKAKVAQKLLRKRSPSSMTTQDLRKILQEMLGNNADLENSSFSFLLYARLYWWSHLQDLDNQDKYAWALFCRFVDCSDTVDRPWQEAQPKASGLARTDEYPTEIQWIIRNDHAALLLHDQLLAQSNFSPEVGAKLLVESCFSGRMAFVNALLSDPARHMQGLAQAFHAAADGGCTKTIEKLLARTCTIGDGGETYCELALQTAAVRGHLELVEQLIAVQDTRWNTAGVCSREVLNCAALAGQAEVIERLLLTKVNLNRSATTSTLGDLRNMAQKVDCEGTAELGVYLNAPNSFRLTALQAAALGGHAETVQLLLAAQADISQRTRDGQTALHLAAQEGHHEVVRRLLAAKANVNVVGNDDYSALHIAAYYGHSKVVQSLLAAGANMSPVARSGQTMLHLVAKGGLVNVAKEILFAKTDVGAKNCAGQTALHLAAQQGSTDMIGLLLAAEANVNAKDSKGQTALHLAAKENHLEAVRKLLRTGAKVNAQDGVHQTALHLAAMKDNLMIARELITAKADVHVRDTKGQVALHVASREGCLAIVNELLDAKCGVETRDRRGQTALHLAAKCGHDRVVGCLLGAGADVNARDWENKTAMNLTAGKGNVNMARELIAAVANVHIQDTKS